MNRSPPASQKADARPISFLLVDQSSTSNAVSSDRAVTLYVRPEELSRTDSSRINAQQTLGTQAWADNFGPGIPIINIAGHTGWRRGSDDQDGGERFTSLKTQVFDDWHKRRKDAVSAGSDPDNIKLIFADALDGFAVVVVPMSFTLLRNKARPLLYQYRIAMQVVDTNIDQQQYLGTGSRAGTTSELQASGLDSLIGSINRIEEYAKDVQNFIDRTLAVPVAKFMNQTARVYRAVESAIAAGDNVAESLISVARMSSQAGLNLFRTASAIANLPSHIRTRMMQVAGAYSNVFCVLRNAVNQQLFYPDYSPLFGASNCSSTSGGRPPSPLSGVNPFYYVNPTPPAPPVQATSESQRSMKLLASNDVVLNPMSVPDLRATVSSIVDGVTFS